MTRPFALALLATLPAFQPSLADEPDSALNPVTGYIETVTAEWNGTDHDITLTVDRGELPPLTYDVLPDSTEDVGPRLAIAETGAVCVVWTRDAATDAIHLRRRSAGGSWGTVEVLSEASESSRNPEVLVDGETTRVVYEIEGSTTQSVAAVAIDDEPDPIGMRTIVATTSSTLLLDARIQAAGGHVWISWVQANEVGWVELASGSWTSPSFEGYEEGDEEGARDRVKEAVLSE
jgi:hypothetical protein